MAKAIQTISECRKLIREVNEQVRKANEADNIDVKNKSLSKWASNMAGKLKKKFRAKSIQNEAVNKKLINDLKDFNTTINILNDEETELHRDEVSGKLSDCFEVELYNFSKSKKPFWHGYIDAELIINIMNGEEFRVESIQK